jgi:hypothetical protein
VVEHLTFNQGVPGSIPGGRTTAVPTRTRLPTLPLATPFAQASVLQKTAREIHMAENQKAKHGDSESGQKNDQEKGKAQTGQQWQGQQEGNRDSRFGQGGSGDQTQGGRNPQQGS